MKKNYTLVAVLLAGAISTGGSAQVFAQTYETNISNTQNVATTQSTNCIAPSPTTISSGVSTAHTIATTPDYTISYQGGSVIPITTNTSIYPTISITTNLTPTATTISYQDTINYSLNTTTSTTSSYLTIHASTISPDYTINNQNIANLTLNNSTTNTDPVSVNSTNSCTNTTDTNLPSPYANLTVNDTGIVYVAYDGSATLNWESQGMDSCTVDPLSQSGTSGTYTLQNITSNTTVTLNCNVTSHYPNFTVFPSSVQIKVLPPTFEYLKTYVSHIQPSGTKKVNLTSVSNFVDLAQKAKKTDLTQSFLLKSVDNLKQQGAKGTISSAQITKYESAVNYLVKTLPVLVDVSADGCSVTATGPAGLTLQYGANENMRRGYGNEATIPSSGTITEPIYAPNGWQSTGEVVDAAGLIYARDTQDVTTDNCPTPPVVYDPASYNGYPEKWAVPEAGTVIDDWGYYNKTAESYVAFRVTDSGRTFPTGYGSASEWLAKATSDGYIVDHPQAGDIAINTLDETFGGPIAWYIDSVDAQGNYQSSAIRSDGNMIWAGGTVTESSYLKYIRIP